MIKRGKVINIRRKKIYILTNEKEFVIVKRTNEPPIVGEIYSGELYNLKLKLKPFIFATLILFSVLGLSRFMKSSISNLILTVQMSSTFRIHINAYDEIVKIETLNEDSKLIVKLLPLKGEPIDTGLILLFNTCKVNDIISEPLLKGQDSIHIFVSNNIKKRVVDFHKFQEYLRKQNIKLDVNLDGEGNL